MASFRMLSSGEISPVFSHPIWNSYLFYLIWITLRVAEICGITWVHQHHIVKAPTMLLTLRQALGPGGGKNEALFFPKRAHGLIVVTFKNTFIAAVQGTGHYTWERWVKGHLGAQRRDWATMPVGVAKGLQRRWRANWTLKDLVLPARRERKNSRHRKKEEKWSWNIKHGVFWELQIVGTTQSAVFKWKAWEMRRKGGRSQLIPGPTFPVTVKEDSRPKMTGTILERSWVTESTHQFVIISHIAVFFM